VTLLLLVVPLTWSIRDAKPLTRPTRASSRTAGSSLTSRRARTSLRIPRRRGSGRSMSCICSCRAEAAVRSEPQPRETSPEGIRYVIVTGSVTDRVLAARSSYPRESAFYDALRSGLGVSTTSSRANGRQGPGSRFTGFNGAVKRLGVLALASFALAGCGANDSVNASAKLRCPAKALAGWQRLADRIHAPVFCPAWIPDPLDGVIGASGTTSTRSAGTAAT
jgi:hypothetical protein